jgi:hypothetical protein
VGAVKRGRTKLAVDYDRNSDVLYIGRGDWVAVEGEGRADGLELDYALADGKPCGATVIGFRRNGWPDRLDELAGLVAAHLGVTPETVSQALQAEVI